MSIQIKPYPLYDKLKAKINLDSNKEIDVKRMCTTINNITKTNNPEQISNHYKEIFALVFHHELVTNNGNLSAIVPYDGKLMVGGKGILFYTDKLPPQLVQIISQYLEDPNI